MLWALSILYWGMPGRPEPAAMAALALAVLVALAWFYFLLAGLSVLAVFLRAFFALFPVGFVAAGVIFLITRIDTLEAAETRALIAASVVAAGWVVGFVTTEWRTATQEQERRRDMITAALTEIELIVDHGNRANWEQVIQATKTAFFEDKRYQAFVYYGHQYGTLRRLVEQIEILRQDQIRPVMDFFQLLDRLERMETRISSDAFTALPSERREAGLVRYLNMQAAVPRIGERACTALRQQDFHGVLRHIK